MKDAFKIKKGLNVQPTDPADVVNPEAGDIIVDSTDDNRMKVYDPTAGEFSAVGTGGSSGNILADIEKLTPTVSNVVAVTDTTVFLPIDDNNKSVKATFSGSDGTIRYEAPASADLDGVQGVVKVWIKTSLENLSLVATKDGVAQNNGLTINSTNKWRQYEIPVVLGDANYGFEIQASGAVSGDVYIDEAFVKVEQVTQNVGQAHFVGSLIYSPAATCFWQVGTTSYSNFAAVPACNNVSVSGGVLTPTTAIPGLRIPNARVDGVYKVVSQGFFYLDGPGSDAEFTLSDGTTTSGYTTANSTSNARLATTLQGVFKFSTGGEKTIQIQGAAQSGSFASIYSSGFGRVLDFDVYFYPDDKTTIVTQDTELTAKTANEFSALILSDGTVIQENYDWIDGNCVEGANPFPMTCTYKSGLVSNPMNCQATISYGNTSAYIAKINSSTSTAVEFQRSLVNGSGDGALSAFLHCSKTGTDVNKSQTIVGKFENINSTDLRQVVVEQITNFTSVATPYDVIFSNEIKDDFNIYNNTTGIITPDVTSLYDIDAQVQAAFGGSLSSIQLYNITDSIGYAPNPETATDFHRLNGSFLLEAGKQYTIRLSNWSGTGTLTSVSNTSVRHRLTITQNPDYEAIVKNLSDQKVKCQTKFLSTNTLGGATGTVSELTFSGLTLGKKYRVTGQIDSTRSNVAVSNKILQVAIRENGNTIQESLVRNYAVGEYITNIYPNKIFTSSGGDLTTVIISNNDMLIAGQEQKTFLQLCELPDTYVETDEW